MWLSRRCQASYPVPVTGLVLSGFHRHEVYLLNILIDQTKENLGYAKNLYLQVESGWPR